MLRVFTILLVIQLGYAGHAKLPFNGVRFFNAIPPPSNTFVFELNDILIATGTPYLRASRYVDIVDGQVQMNGVLKQGEVTVAALSQDNWSGHQTWIALHDGTGPALMRAPNAPNFDKSTSLLYIAHASPDSGTITATWTDSIPNQVTYGNTLRNIALPPGRHSLKLEMSGVTFFERSFKMPRKGITMVIISGSPTDTLNPLTVTVLNKKGKPVRLKSVP